MRKRKDIEAEISPTATEARMLKVIVELLLDIREMLKAEK